MKAIECSHESEVLAAVASGEWPDRSARGLAGHVKTCAICQDVAEVAMALRSADVTAVVRMPSSAHMWFRLQMRARQDAARAAARPIAVVQGVAAASAVGLILAIVGFGWVATAWAEWPWSRIVTGIGPAANGTLGAVMAFVTATPQTTMLLGLLLAGLVLMPVAVYVALSE